MTIDYTQIWIERARKERMKPLKQKDLERICTYFHECIRKACENCRRQRELGKGENSKCLYPNCNRKILEEQLIMGKGIPRGLSEHLVTSPYPKKYETLWKLRDGRTVLLRAIKSEDEPLWLEMFKNLSEESIRYRFFHIIKEISHEERMRYCNIDYDREIAIVAELTEDRRKKILGVVRLCIEPNMKKGEIAVIVADPWQGLGLGSKMVDYMIEICKDKKLETIYGLMLSDNYRAIRLMRKMGFTIRYLGDGVKATLNLNT